MLGWNKCSDLFFYLSEVFFRSLFGFRAEHARSCEYWFGPNDEGISYSPKRQLPHTEAGQMTTAQEEHQ
jgi:hypothetical protein